MIFHDFTTLPMNATVGLNYRWTKSMEQTNELVNCRSDYRRFGFWRSTGHFAIGLLVATTLVACGGSSGNDVGNALNATFESSDCSVATQKEWAYDAMQDYYVFYDQVPVVDPQRFSSANDVVRNVRFQERDPFSGVSGTATSSLLFDEGRSFGLGYGVLRDDNDDARVVLVYDESPFGFAGVERGDIILSVDGIDWGNDELNNNFSARVIGTPENPSTASWKFQKHDSGNEVELEITAAEYGINSVLAYDTYSIDSLPSKVGYLAFNVFLNTSAAELDEAFEAFADENIGELVLDLRYNGGGRISIARYLASLIGTNDLAGETLYRYQNNDKYRSRDYSLNFLSGLGELNLNRVVILTTSRTASSSEIVIAGLQPYLTVVTVGSTSSGKPYVSSPVDRCDERLNIMEAEGFNANDVSVFGGVPATCLAADDRTQGLGLNPANNEFEGLLNAGINYIINGQCDTVTVASADAATRSASDDKSLDRRVDSLDLVDGVAF